MRLLTTIGRMATTLREKRRLARAYAEIRDLPEHIQKDIGWPNAFLSNGSDRYGRMG